MMEIQATSLQISINHQTNRILGRKFLTLLFKFCSFFQYFFIFFPQAILSFDIYLLKRWIKTRINSSRQFYFFIIFHRSHFDQELLLISCDKEVAESFRRSIWLDQYRLSDHFIEEKYLLIIYWRVQENQDHSCIRRRNQFDSRVYLSVK